MMSYQEFESVISRYLGPLSEAQKEAFAALDGLYRDWNSKINVISRKDIDSLYEHHILHSLCIALYLKTVRPQDYLSWQEGNATVLDLGTGGGFPGIPLAIMFPGTEFTLCDSVGKKTLVAGSVAQALGLKNVKVVNARAESLGRSFDYVVSRAVASLQDFYPWVKGCYNKRILYLRGGDVAGEISPLISRYKLKDIDVWPVFGVLDGEYFNEKWIVDISRK